MFPSTRPGVDRLNPGMVRMGLKASQCCECEANEPTTDQLVMASQVSSGLLNLSEVG